MKSFRYATSFDNAYGDDISQRPQVRLLAKDKLDAIAVRIEELEVLRDELTLLLNLCADAEAGWPILESLSNPLIEKTS